MKKRLAALFCATLAASMILVGCQASKGLETDNLKITRYNGLEVSAADKPEKVTDDDVEQEDFVLVGFKPEEWEKVLLK